MGVEIFGASVGLVLNFDEQIRGLDIDGFNGFTDDTSNGVKDLAGGLELTLLEGLMEEFGTHVLKASEHIFAILFPVFINELFDFSPIPPSGLNRDLFFLGMVVNECSSGEAIKLSSIEASNTSFYDVFWRARARHRGYEEVFF